MLFECLPLPGEDPLLEAVERHLFRQLPACPGEVAARAQLRLPFHPGGFVARELDGAKEREVVEPGALLVGICVQRAPAPKAAKDFAQEPPAKCGGGGVIDPTLGELRRAREVPGREQALLRQLFQADEQRAAGECGLGAVRRIAISDGADGKHLPAPLVGAAEELRKRARPAEIAVAVRAGQGGRVEKDSACPLAEIGCQRRAFRGPDGTIGQPPHGRNALCRSLSYFVILRSPSWTNRPACRAKPIRR